MTTRNLLLVLAAVLLALELYLATAGDGPTWAITLLMLAIIIVVGLATRSGRARTP